MIKKIAIAGAVLGAVGVAVAHKQNTAQQHHTTDRRHSRPAGVPAWNSHIINKVEKKAKKEKKWKKYHNGHIWGTASHNYDLDILKKHGWKLKRGEHNRIYFELPSGVRGHINEGGYKVYEIFPSINGLILTWWKN